MSSQSRAVLKGTSFKYGMPLYGLAWPSGDTFILCGGGGNGIKNRIVCAESKQGRLSDVITEHQMGDDCPMKLAMSPDGRSILLCMGKGGLKRVDLDLSGTKFTPTPLPLGPEVANLGTGEVKSLAFSSDGKILAVGMASGELYVLHWPSLAAIMILKGEGKLSEAVRDVDLGDSKSSLLALTLDNGSAEVWDYEIKALVCRMEPGKTRENLSRVISLGNGVKTVAQPLPEGISRVQISKIRFARDETGEVITLLRTEAGSAVARWSVPQTPEGKDRGLLSYVSSKHLSPTPCTCFETSPDGKLLAFGTSEGDVFVTTAVNYKKVAQAAKAHMVFSTAVAFAVDTPGEQEGSGIKNYRVISVSADASARILGVPSSTVSAAVAGKGSLPPFLLLALLLLFFIVAVLGLTQYGEIRALIVGKEEL